MYIYVCLRFYVFQYSEYSCVCLYRGNHITIMVDSRVFPLSQILMMGECSAFFGSFSSNVGILVYDLQVFVYIYILYIDM